MYRTQGDPVPLGSCGVGQNNALCRPACQPLSPGPSRSPLHKVRLSAGPRTMLDRVALSELHRVALNGK